MEVVAGDIDRIILRTFYKKFALINNMVRKILIDQREELEERIKGKKIVERECLKIFKEYARSSLVKVTMGVRRCGKSFLTYLLLKDRVFGYVNFDEDILLKVRSNQIISALHEIYGGNMNVIFLDEVQNYDGWELFINKLNRSGYDVFVTGSNAKLLSKELATHLTGRHISLELFPFSFGEYLIGSKIKINPETSKGKGIIKNELKNYMVGSGFPEVIVENENPRIYLRELYRHIVEKDIILRYNIRYKETFKEIALTVMSNFSNLISFNKLKKQFSLGSEHTVKNYISYLEEAYLVFTLKKFSYKPREIEQAPKKIYSIDTGFLVNVAHITMENLGRLMENLVAIELKRRGKEIYYWKDYQGREVDFVVKDGLNVKELIQVCYDIEDLSTKNRELRALVKASKELKCKNLKVITWDYEAKEEFKNREIEFRPLWKWLLGI